MSMSMPLNPKPFLNALAGKQIAVKLKWGQEYRGYLLAVDNYMNLQMTKTDEYIAGKHAGAIGECLVRCNNVLYIRELEEALQKSESMED